MSQPVFIPNMDYIRIKDPKFHEALVAIQGHLRPATQPAPPPVNSIIVTAANGWFTVALTDNGNVNAGISYFAEYSLTAGFEQPIMLPMGPSRTVVKNLGNQTLFWRAHSQYQNPFSLPSPTIVFGGATPTPVIGGGAVSPPAVISTGSGTSATNGQQSGAGFGNAPTRGPGNRPALL